MRSDSLFVAHQFLNPSLDLSVFQRLLPMYTMLSVIHNSLLVGWYGDVRLLRHV